MRLASLVAHFGRRAKALDLLSRRISSLPLSDFERERLACFAVLELSNLNAEWLRRYYVAVSMNEAVKLNGRRITIGRKHQDIDEAIAFAIDKIVGSDAKLKWLAQKTRFLEPNWSAVNTLPRLASMLNFPDKNVVGTAIAAGRDAINTLRAARNFYAHRNIDTKLSVAGQLNDMLHWGPFGLPSEEIFNCRVGAFSSLFSFWLDDGLRVNKEVCEAP